MTSQNAAAAVESKAVDEAAPFDGCPRRRPGRPRIEGNEWVHRDQLRELPDRQRVILSLSLQGFKHKEIGARVGCHEKHVSRVVRQRRYIEARNQVLAAADEAFLMLGPQVRRVVENGLESADLPLALRAAELFFKAVGYGGFGHGREGTRTSAEDIAQVLFARRAGESTP